MSMDPMEEIRQMFFVECDELLEALQDGLEILRENPESTETIDTVFRAVHSIKGGAAAFGLDELVGFSHEFETVLDGVRSGNLAVSGRVLATLQSSADTLNEMVANGKAGTTTDEARISSLISALNALAEVSSDDAKPVAGGGSHLGLAVEPDTPANSQSGDGPGKPRSCRILFRPRPDLFKRGNEPGLILREIVHFGKVSLECDTSNIPLLRDIDPFGAYLTWTVGLETVASSREIREVFEFVEDDCDLEIGSQIDRSTDGTVVAAGKHEPADEMVTASAAVAEKIMQEQEPTASLAAQVPEPPQMAENSNVKAEGRSGEKAAAKSQSATVRVDLERVDRLINLVGELVINQAMLSQSVTESGMINSTAIAAGLEEFKHLTREVQESVLAIRAQPIKPLFQRMSRILREAVASVGKQANIVVQGELTEVDKTVIERLSDPLTHMVRNAIDHGLESPSDREACGKDRTGTIRLTAEHRSGRVLIEVSDDGAGINRARVRQIAIEKGLIQPNADLNNTEIDNLLFVPGFSTATQVSGLSGRGVGMDVVRQSIINLGGKISILSEPGQGTVFSISLPLTLAILDGMVVRAGGQTIVVPLSAVLEMIQPDQVQIHRLGSEQSLVLVRGQFIPAIDVGYRLGFSARRDDISKSVILLIETSDGAQRALVVDAIQDQRQVVIKGLEDNYGAVRGIAAATILGDGRIALILDPDAIASDGQPTGRTSESIALAG